MSAEENSAIVQTFYDAFNAHDFDRVCEMVTPDATWANAVTGEIFQGPAGFRHYLQTWDRAFPDARLEITNIVAGEHGAAVEFTGSGTNTGPLMTPIGEIPPTGRRAEQRFCDLYQIRDGKIARARTYFDIASLLTYFDVEGLMRELRLST